MINIKSRIMAFRYLVFLFLILGCLVKVKAEDNKASFQILILNTEDENYQSSNILSEAFRKEIQYQNVDIDYFFENLNHYLYFEDRNEYYKSLASSFKIKYKNHHPSLILAINFAAVDFLRQYADSIFPGIPVVIVGTNEANEANDVFKNGNFHTKKNWYEVLDTLNISQMLLPIEQLQPKTTKIYAIVGEAFFEKAVKKWMKSESKSYIGKAEIIFTNNVTFEEVLNLVKNADDHSVIYYFFFFQDATGRNFNPEFFLKELSKSSRVPIYVMSRQNIKDQELGGYVINFESLGKIAALKCLDILKNQGTPIPHTEKVSTCKYVFNWRALKRFGIDSDSLPKGSEVILREYSVWQIYWPYILGGLSLFFLQTYFIILLLQNRNKLRLAELQLVDINQSLEYTVDLQVAEIKKQNKKLSETNEQIVSLQKFKEEMTNTIVHDLKAPLYGIINPSIQLSPENKLEQVKHAALKLLNMVLNILDVYKYESTTMVLDKEACHLADIANTAIEYVKYLSERKNINIENNIRSGTGIFADKEILTRIFINLLSNAIKFTPNNGNITIGNEEATISPGFVKIKVIDNGIGIPIDKRQIVFEKFQQVGSMSKGSGHSSGLGLTFCRMAVETHGGAIWIDGQTEVGTTVWFTIPSFSITDEAPDKIKTKETEIVLTHAEKVSLKDIIPLLEKCEVSEITSLRKILRKIENEKLGNENWLKALKNAVDYCNEELYEELIDKAKEV